jgi:hypothetical protein
MKPTWYLLIDGLSRHNTTRVNPVLGGVRDMAIARQLRRGMMDSDILATEESYESGSLSCEGFGAGRFSELPPEIRNGSFLQKRSIVEARIAGFTEWDRLIREALALQQDLPFDPTPYLARELDRSTKEHMSELLLDYSQASDVPPAEAFDFLTLYVRERMQERVVLHALAEKFSKKINACSTKEEIDSLRPKMARAFVGKRSV